MLSILTVTLPIYAVMGIGYGTVRWGLFKPEDMAVLSRYILNIALPVLLFGAVAQRDVSEVLNLSYIAAFAGAGLLTMTLSHLSFRLTDPDRGRAAVAFMGAGFPNSAFIGFPIVASVFPDQAPVVLALNFLVENMIFLPISLIIFELARAEAGASIPKLLRGIAWDILTRPLMIGLLLGTAVMVSGVALPTALVRFTDLLGGSVSALALVVIGGSLVGLPMQGNRPAALRVAGAKLLLHPAMAVVTTAALPLLGLAVLAPELHGALIISAAIPTFAVFAVIAGQYGKGGLASLVILFGTVGSFVTLTGLLMWLGVT